MIEDRSEWKSGGEGPVILINLFTPKPGQLEAFISAQTGEYRRLQGKVAGWKGNRLHRSLDGKTAVNYAVFQSLDAYKAWRESALFAEHVEVIRPFVEKSEPGLYEPLYEAGF